MDSKIDRIFYTLVIKLPGLKSKQKSAYIRLSLQCKLDSMKKRNIIIGF